MDQLQVGRIAQMWRWPIKSAGGQKIQQTRLAEEGMLGDRTRVIIDDATNRAVTGKVERYRRILDLETRVIGGPQLFPTIEISLNGQTVRSDSLDANAALSRMLGFKSRLESIGNVYQSSLETVRDGRFIGTQKFVDKAPLHIITLQGLRVLEDLLGRSVDLRRFRPNLVVNATQTGMPELDWIGQVIQIGEVKLEITEGTKRCALPRQPQAGLDWDQGLTDLIKADFGHRFGVYAEVVREGHVRQGNALNLLSA